MPLTVKAASQKDKTNAKACTMQHRQYAFIAGIIGSIEDTSVRLEMALKFAGELQRTNIRFDYNRFTRACNVIARER
jgi:hypothetical protein